jgi:PHD/YefM family antitoxin component YafN of YafNO toxin-antitoxin module
MPNIQPISILREKKTLDQISESKEPLFITKNGSAYLVILSPDFYDEIIKEMNHYKLALERERELRDLALKVNKSRDSIKAGKSYSEEEFDRMMETIV